MPVPGQDERQPQQRWPLRDRELLKRHVPPPSAPPSLVKTHRTPADAAHLTEDRLCPRQTAQQPRLDRWATEFRATRHHTEGENGTGRRQSGLIRPRGLMPTNSSCCRTQGRRTSKYDQQPSHVLLLYEHLDAVGGQSDEVAVLGFPVQVDHLVDDGRR